MAGIICRIIGLLYRSPLTGIIGETGNGFYAPAYRIYQMILLISSYSIPSAVSKVISQRLAVHQYKNAQRIFRCSLIYVMIVGGAASVFAFVFADLLSPGKAAMVLRMLAPTIFFSGLLGVLRGYFQATKTMVPTSISQIMEQILNAVVSIGAAFLLMKIFADTDDKTRAAWGAVGSAVGTGIGVLTALAFMFLLYEMNKKVILDRVNRDTTPNVLTDKQIFRIILSMVTPVILSTFAYDASALINQTLYLQVMEKYPGCVSLFVLPPSFAELRRRLEGRQTDAQEVIERRLKNAREEVKLVDRYQYVIVNDDLETAYQQLRSITEAEKRRTVRCKPVLEDA